MANESALIIGIDGYQANPLTSAVNDAWSFRDALLKHRLVDPARIEILTSPVTTPQGVRSHGPADLSTIKSKLQYYYSQGQPIDRFYFFYAGHGLLAYQGVNHARSHTVLVPSDVVDVVQDNHLLIDFDEYLDLMWHAGPQEQIYFGSCRPSGERWLSLPSLRG